MAKDPKVTGTRSFEGGIMYLSCLDLVDPYLSGTLWRKPWKSNLVSSSHTGKNLMNNKHLIQMREPKMVE